MFALRQSARISGEEGIIGSKLSDNCRWTRVCTRRTISFKRQFGGTLPTRGTTVVADDTHHYRRHDGGMAD